MKNINVWFDGWFSSAYSIMELIKKNPDNRPIKIFATHHKDMGYRVLCDEFSIRPNWNEWDTTDRGKYIQWVNEFCKNNKIDIFFPRRFFDILSLNKDAIRLTCGTEIVLDENNIVTQLNSKIATACIMSAENLATPVPMQELHRVEEVEEFKEYLKDIKFNYNKLCIKPNIGTGAEGFKVLDLPRDYYFLEKLLQKNQNYIIMPYLEGQEISVDCLNTENGLIAVPRFKHLNSRVQDVILDKALLERVGAISQYLELVAPFNIQFKIHNKILILLEINTRMSGGVHLSALAGANIPYLTVKKYLLEKFDLPTIKECSVCNVERGIIL